MLTVNDFFIGTEGRESKLLFRDHEGISLILIRSKESRGFDPIFAKLGADRNLRALGIEFLAYDIGHQTNRKIVAMSQQTNTPILATPTLLLYIDGRARAKISHGEYRVMAANIQKAVAAIQAQDDAAAAEAEAEAARRAASRARPSSGGRSSRGSGVSHTASTSGFGAPARGGRTSEPSKLRSGGRSQNSFLPEPEDDEDGVLQIPDSIIPHNIPWMSSVEE